MTQRIRLVLVGGSRNDGDAQRVDELRKLTKELYRGMSI